MRLLRYIIAVLLAGQVVAHYSYDGLGRLIRTQRPGSGEGDTLKVTDLFYDGARVVQEVTMLRRVQELRPTKDMQTTADLGLFVFMPPVGSRAYPRTCLRSISEQLR